MADNNEVRALTGKDRQFYAYKLDDGRALFLENDGRNPTSHVQNYHLENKDGGFDSLRVVRTDNIGSRRTAVLLHNLSDGSTVSSRSIVFKDGTKAEYSPDSNPDPKKVEAIKKTLNPSAKPVPRSAPSPF